MFSIATIGFFDGVHKGHQYLFEQLIRTAHQRGLVPLVFTFHEHPRSVLQSDYVPHLLTSQEERVERIHNLVGTAPTVLNFSAVQKMTAAEFMQWLHDEFDVRALLMGYDHMFGSDRLHRAQDYKHLGEQIDIEVLTLNEFTEGEMHVSSTEIRLALERGNILLANELLGRPYQLSGTVVHGNGIGRTIGFPTANIVPDNSYKIIPKNGVYIGKISTLRDNDSHTAFINIGNNPTVGNAQQTIEVHIPGLSSDLYDQHMTISFERFLRDERKFASLADLQRQIREDLSNASKK